MAFYCNGKRGICDKISSSFSICPLDCEFEDGTGGYEVEAPMPKPMTNADHIRSMSDEELAEMFHGGGLCSYIQAEHNAHCEARGTCDNCVVEWLKQPYKENTDD